MATTLSPQKLHPEVGTPVVASDGKELGRVKEVADSYLKVDVRWARDYWLSFEDVLSADSVKTLLIIPSDQISAYKRDRPHAVTDGGASPSSEWLDREMMGRR